MQGCAGENLQTRVIDAVHVSAMWTYALCGLAEYVVSFTGYFKANARRRFIAAALQESGLAAWKIIPRLNPANEYPSDFDVVKVGVWLKFLLSAGDNLIRYMTGGDFTVGVI